MIWTACQTASRWMCTFRIRASVVVDRVGWDGFGCLGRITSYKDLLVGFHTASTPNDDAWEFGIPTWR